MDDLVIKSRTEDEIVRDIEETFKTLREINMKLNPKKCIFGVKEGMFLGYKVNTKGLKVCPDKKSDFHWTAEAEEAFKQMKQLITELPMLAAPMEKEELIVYLATAKETISAVPMTEREAKQMPIYFVNRALRGPEINYTSMEKLVLALVHANGSRAGLILTNPEGMEFTYALRFSLQENVDSRLVANQVNGTYVAKEPDMIRYLEKVRILTSSFKAFSIRQVPRSENKKANKLSKITSTSFAHLSKQVLVEELKEKSISEVEILAVVEEEGETWMTPIFEYLTKETLPADVKKGRAVRRKSYMHVCTRSVVTKALRIGCYWATMYKDARTLIRACQECQVHKPVLRNPQQKLTPITSPWSFYKWIIDIAGPFPEGHGKVKFLIVAIDYFIKWIEAKPVATITGNQIKKFMWNNIVCRFGLPGEIISDNGKYLGEGIKARLDERIKSWMEELPHVLWAHRTMIKSIDGDTPFSLTYVTEAVIPAEISMPTLRTAEVDLVQNNKALEINLDLLEEKREQAAIREAKSKEKMEKYYNSKVRSISFKPGDLVYRNNDASRAEDTGKLGPK
ncbi:reverse transcriptase domain-containing protein [Tanacetum coccineum]|uniref:Reverse transcriptase domain-containing protein n=1 Tax=Tanacetum coccineum TaxID=301880 RepID=A0ABQ4YIJ5_9ASTR